MLDRELRFARSLHSLVTLWLTLIFCLVVTEAAGAQTTLSASSLNFGSVVLNQKSGIQSFTLTNNQAIPLQIISISLPASTEYAIDPSTTCPHPGTLGVSGSPTASCTVALTFSPIPTLLPPTGTLTITTNASNSPQKVTLSATVVAQSTLSSTGVNFGNVALSETSAIQAVKLTNNQTTTLHFTSFTVTSGSEYAMNPASTCLNSPTLAAGASCMIDVTFSPTGLGAQPAGMLTIVSSAGNSPQSITMVGTGVPQVLVVPGSLSFAAQYVGTTSAPQALMVTNEQLSSLSISSVTISGSNPNDFAVVNSCPIAPSTLGTGVPCNISVTFKPTASGTRTATLNINDNAPGGSQTIPLTGTANAPVTLSTSLINNFTAAVGTISPFQTITITNSNTGAPLHISSFQFSGDFEQTSTSCGNAPPYTLAGGATCNVTVSFASTVSGTRTGQLQVFDDAGTSPQVVNLSGVGTSPLTIAPTQLIFSAEKLGTTSPSQTITLTNHENKAETFSISVTGDFAATSSCPTGTIPANSSCSIAVVFSPPLTETPGPVSGSMSVTDSATLGALPSVSLTGSATTLNPPAAVQWVSPGAGAAGTTVHVVITGNMWTHFSSSSAISFVDTDSPAYASDITVQSFTSPSPNEIDATLVIAGGSNTVYGARNIYVTTPLSGGGSETAYLFQAFIIADPTNAHNITALSPTFGTQGQTLDVGITATGTQFVQGTTIANFGDGVNVNWLTVTSSTTATANITISNWTNVGYRTVTLATGGEFAVTGYTLANPSGTPTFQIGPNNATLLTVTPNSEGQSWSGPISLTASGSHFVPNATQVTIGGGVIVGDVNVITPTTATAQIAIPANATPGVWDVTVSTGGEIETLSSSFTIINTTPAITSVVPSSGAQGQTLNVVINGNAFTNFSPGAISAEFTGEIAVNSVTVNSTSQVTANITISQNANVGGITANLISGTTIFPFSFSVTPSSAQIVSVAPANVPQGGQVTLTIVGSNTHWVQGTTTSGFYPQDVPTPSVDEVIVNDATDAQLNIAVPTNTPPGDYGFWMATGGEVVSSSIHVYPHTPTLAMSPANGLLPTSPATSSSFTVNFTGQFTHWVQSTPALPTDTLPVIAGEGVTLSNFTVTSPSSATATLTISAAVNGTPTATGLRLVTFTTGTEIVTTNFNVTSTPVGLVSIDPWHAPQSVTLDVAIVGLNTHFTSGTTQVLFGPQITVNSTTVTDSTHLTANITTSYLLGSVLTATPPGGYTVYVNTGSEQVIGGFTVDPPATPTIVSVSPSSAQQGSTVNVTITGSLTNWVQGQTEAILGAGVDVANLTIVDATHATATIAVSPTAPLGGNSVIFITGTEIDSGTGFSVTPGASSISTIVPGFSCSTVNNVAGAPPNCNPAFGITVVAQKQTASLHISATGTHWLQGETYLAWEDQNGNPDGGIHVDSLTITSPTTADIQFTVLSTAPVGFTSLTMITDGEVVTLDKAIDVEEGSATLLAFSPGGGQQGNTMTLQLLGRFTHWDATTTAAFSPLDLTVNSYNVIDSETMTINVTVSPWAYVDYSWPCSHVLTITTTDVSQGTGGSDEQVSTTPLGTGNFCVAQGAEQINSVSPLNGVQGSTLPVTITGSATNFVAGETTVDFGDPNFQVGEVTVTSPTTLTVPVGISTAASTGFKQVTVTTLGQVAQQVYSFTVTPGVAILTEANPNHAEQGIQNLDVILTGQYSHFSSLSTATFGAGIVVNSVTYNSPTQITANISIDPVSFTGGRTVTVTTPGVSCAYQPIGITYNGCIPGSSSGTGSEIVTDNAFTIIPGPAIISDVSPNAGNEGQEIVFNITGSATHWQQNLTQFYMTGAFSDITVNSLVINNETSATVDISISPTANPGARSIFMITDGESLTDSGAFVVTGGIPVITYLSPNNAVQGTTGLGVTINGNAYTTWDSTSTINFGPGVSVVSYQDDDASHIEAVLNIDPAAQPGYRTVTVQTGTQTLAGNFLVTAPAPPPTPYIAYYWPNSGLTGQTLTVNFSGAYTHWVPGLAGTNNPVTTVTYGDGIILNSEQDLGPTQYTSNITIAPDAVPGQRLFVFSTPTSGANPEEESVPFTVISSTPASPGSGSVTPTLTIIDPSTGMQGAQDLIVNILGQFTSFDSTTTFSFGPGITVNGPPTILGSAVATQSISISKEAPTGGYPVTANTPDATLAAQQVVSGAYFTVTPSLALISAVTPNTGLQGNVVTVDVTGQNTTWNGSTVFTVGSGIVVSNVTVNSNTDATMILTIPAYAPLGVTYVTATTLGEVATINHGFVVQAGTPLLLSSGPGSLPQQSSAIFTILSQATQWTAANPPTIDYGAGVVLTNVNVTSPTSLTVNGYIQPTTNVGWRNLTVTSGTQVLGLSNALYVNAGPAVINSVTANTAGQGATLSVTIQGTNTNWQQGITTLNFPNVVINGMPTVVSPTEITANITVNDSAPAGEESVTATTLGEVATGVNVFNVTQTQPELLAVVASTGASAGLNNAVQGWTGNVNLTGAFTHFTNSSVVSFGSGITVNSVSASSATSLQVNITISPTIPLGWHTVSVTSLGGSEVVSIANGFQVTVGPAAIIEALNPYNAPQNWSGNVLVVGSQTHWVQGITTANFGPYISINSVTVADYQHATVNITVQPNAPLNFYNVSLTTVGEVATGLGAFTVTQGAPSLIAVNPPFAHLGDGDAPYFVEITGQYTHFVAGTSVANFGAGITVNSIVVNSPTDIQANITVNPVGTTGSRTITVTTGTEVASMVGGFTVLPGVPALTTAVPSSGQAGQTVTVVINGQFTSFQQGFTTVTFGGGLPTPSIVTVNSLKQVQATLNIPSNATVGTSDITVTTSGTPLTLSGGFTVTPGTPVITQINPNIGNPGQTALTINLTGQYTAWTAASTVTIGTVADGITVVGAAGPGQPGPVTYNSPTSVSVSVNIAAGAPVGPANVAIATGGSSQSVAGGFTVQAAVIPPPSVISISPGMNAGGIPINSNFYVVFSQPMNIATFTNSNISLRLTSNQNQGWITIPIGISGDATGRVLTIIPSTPLAVNSQYYLYLSNGIKDSTAAGNSISNYGQYFNTVFTAGTTAPTVNYFNPPASSTVGTNVPIELEFSVPMNQGTETGLTVTGPGGAVAGSFLWNSNPYGNYPGWGPGTVLWFTPTAPLAASTSYTVAWGAPLTDTEGNAVTPGSFTFTTGSGADTTTNSPSSDIAYNQTNVGTNVAPVMFYQKPIDPLYINTSTLALYNSDSGKYINGTVTVAPDGLSATFTPTVPLLPNTYYRFWQGGGYYDADGLALNNTGAYLNGWNTYFTTGSGSDLTAPSVVSVSPANSSTAVPLNAQVIVHFSSPIDPAAMNNIITVTPSGSTPINGTTQLASDLVTLFFEPTSVLAPGTVYTVSVSGYQDVVGNVGSAFSSSFTTANSIMPINVSTGINASGQAILTGNTPDPHWSYVATSIPSGETGFNYPGDAASDAYTGALKVVANGDADWYGGWVGNGPNASWIAINPNSNSGNSGGFYSTTFNLSAPLPAHICLVGSMSHDDSGLLAVNGAAIMSDQGYTGGSLVPLNIEITSNVTTGTNYLIFAFGNTDNNLEGLRLQGVVESCGASETPATSVNNNTASLVVTSATPSYSAGSVPTNSTITLIFNNSLDPATVNSTTLPVMIGWNSNAEIAGGYSVSTTHVPNDTVSFTPDTPFPVSSQIWVGACNGPYDLAGDNAAYNGCYTQITYFNTANTIASGQSANSPFMVTAFTPANGATSVGLRAPVTATFNRSLNLNSVNNNDYALFNGDSQTPWCEGGSYSHSQDGTSISFNCGALPSSATLTAMLGSGLSDWNGDALTPYTSQFSTTYYDSNTHGSLITQRPGNGAGGVDPSLPIVLYFNYPINSSNPSADIQVAQNNVAVPGTAQVLDGGYTLEFTPSVPWTPGALVQWWTTGNMTDTLYNATFNTYSGYFNVANSTATLTPTVQVAIPTMYSSPVPLNSIFDLQFNTPLNPATVNNTNVYIFDNSNGNVHIPVTMAQPQPNEILLTPSGGPLPANHYLYVFIGNGLQSTTSVPATQTQWYEYTGTTSDTTLPLVTSAVPFNGATNIGVNEQPGVIFNKSIDTASLNSSTFQVTNGGTPLAGSYWFSSSDTRVEFIPNAPLPINTNLVMTLHGVTDQVGNPVNYSSSFTTGATPDVTAPSVVTTSIPSNGSVPTNAVITVQFSTSMDASTFTAGQPGSSGNFYVYDELSGDGINFLPSTLTWNASQTVAYLQLGVPLAAGREYYLGVTGGTDLAGNQMSNYGAYFYAEFSSASAAPTVINWNPLSGVTGVGTNVILEAQFSSAIDPNTLSGVTLSSGGSTVTTAPVLSAGNTVLQLVPSTPLAANTNYTITIAGVKDPAGNTVATVTDSFQTGASYDLNAATAVTIDPSNYATVGTNVAPKIVFNKPLNPIYANNSYFQLALQDTGQWIPLTVTLSTDGKTVTLTPQEALLPNTEYRYYAGSGLQDANGNGVNGGWWYFYTSSGAVTSPLTVTSISPANTATGIPLNAQVIVQLSAPMDTTSVTQNSIQLLNGVTSVAGTVNWINNQELSFAPTSALAAGTSYTVNVNGFKDANGNTVTPFSSSFTTGALAGTGGLSFTGSNIGWGATVTNPSQPIVMTFSQPLDPATVNSSTLEVTVTWNSNRGLPGTYTVGTGVNANQVTFTPTNPYPSGAQIFVGSCNGPTDILGDVLSGCYNQLVYFIAPTSTVGAPTSLSILSVSPANGAINVGHDQPVSVTFNNPINSNSTGGYNTQLFAGQDLQQNGSVTFSADGRTLTFNIGALYNGTSYTIAIPAGGLTDEYGNSLTSPFTSTFTTSVNPATGAGSIQSVNPTWNTSGVPTNNLLTLYMNRPVNASTVSNSTITVTVNGQVYPGTVAVTGGYEIQYTPNTPFPYGATVQWWFAGNVQDVYGDLFNGNSSYFYTVGAPPNPATAQPTIVAASPANSSNAMPVNGQIEIEFSQPIDPTTLVNSNLYVNGWSPAGTTIGLEPGSVNTVRVTLNTNWNPSTWYYICLNSNVKGINGVAIPGGCWSTYFYTSASTTPDTTSGTVKIGPPNGSANVGTNAYIRLQFSKPVDITSINTTNIAITTSGNPIPGSFSYSYSGNDLYGVNFSPVNPLPPSSPILVNVNGVLDYAGNGFTAASSSFTTAATPDYSTPQVSLDFASTASGIGTNASFTCHYSEAMDPSSVNTGNTFIYSTVANGNNYATDPWTYTWSTDLTSVTMTPVNPLFANTEYYYACYSAIDLTGNSQSNAASWFYTGSGPSSQGPTLLYANPPNGMINVPVNTNNGPWYGSSLGLLFNEPVASESLGNITLTPNGGSPIPIAVYPEYGNTIVWVQLPWSLSPNTTYTYNVMGVTDMSGNAITPVTSTFTTGSGFDFTNPTVVSTVPANGATTSGIPVSVSLTISEALNPVLITSSQFYLRTHNTQITIPTTVSVSPSLSPSVGTTVTLTPTTPLAESTIYDVIYYPNNWWPTDIAGNNLSNYGTEATFTTGTVTAVNGLCGTANAGSFSAAPPAGNLCSVGTASAITNPGAWTWSCGGQYGGTTASCSASVTAANTPSAQPVGLVSWWPGNDNANDMVGGNNGTLINGASYGLGEVDDAFNFSGSNQYVLIGQPVPANLQIQGAITLSAWIYPTAYPTDNGGGALGLIVGSQHDGSPFGGATIFFDGRVNPDGVTGAPAGHIHFNIGDSSGNGHATNTLTQVPLNQWTLVTATRTAYNYAQIYYNGVLQPSGTSQPQWDGTVEYTGSWFAIGQEVNENRPFTGLIDEVQVYSSALTAAQVQAIYNAGSAGVSPTLNGACGSANGLTFSAQPTANLCSAGSAGSITAAGSSYSWSCNGTNSGSNASCSAVMASGGACYQTPVATPSTLGLVSLWPGNDNANDPVSGNNGALENGVTYAPGKVGDAFSLNGSNQFILIGHPVPSSLQIQNAISLSAWIYPTAYPTDNGSGAYGFIAGSQDDGVAAGATIFFSATTGTNMPKGHVDFQIGDGSSWHDTFTETSLPLNQWTLVTATRTANSAVGNIYFNGAVQPTLSNDPVWNGTISYPNSDWFAIGQEVNENRPFTGLINDVQAYNTVLTATQVQGIYNAGSSGVCP